MKVMSKFALATSLAALLTVGLVAPVYAAPADDARTVAFSVAKGLKGLGGMNAPARARLLAAAVGSKLKATRGLSSRDLASLIAQAVHDASNEYGLAITPRMAADATRIVWALPDGTIVTITRGDGGVLDFTVVAGGDGLTGEEDPVSAG